MDRENQNEPSTVDGILRKIEEKADTGEYLYRGEPERADYNQAMRLTGQPAEAYYHRGNAYGMKGEIDKAIEDFTKQSNTNRITPKRITIAATPITA